MTYAELRAEYERRGIDVGVWTLVRQVTERVAHGYRVEIYNDGRSWTAESLDDLALDVAEQLLASERRQLRYVFDTADAATGDRLDTLRALLGKTVQFALRNRIRTTPIDRLTKRIEELVSGPPFRTLKDGNDLSIVLTGDPRPGRQLTEGEMRRGVALVDSIPRLNTRPNAERESKIYNKADLQELVERLVEAFEPILLADIKEILRNLLTAWVPTLLVSSEYDRVVPSTPEVELAHRQMITQMETFVSSLDPVQRAVFVGKSQQISDVELAERAGVSRPTLIKRRDRAYERLRAEVMDGLPEELHDEATRVLLHACGEYEEVER